MIIILKKGGVSRPNRNNHLTKTVSEADSSRILPFAAEWARKKGQFCLPLLVYQDFILTWVVT
jgi:hypothetical protein